MPKKRTRNYSPPSFRHDASSDSAQRAPVVVTEFNGQYHLAGQYSNGGNEIFSSSRSFVVSIARELSVKGHLDARQFGPYSIYSTYRDFISGHDFVNLELIDSLVETDHVQSGGPCACIWSLSSPELKPQYLALCQELSIAEAENVSSAAYRQSLLSYILRIPDHEVTAFALLNGMKHVPISVSLLWLRGRLELCDLHSYLAMSSANTGSQITDPDFHRGRVPIKDDRDDAVEMIAAFLDQMREND